MFKKISIGFAILFISFLLSSFIPLGEKDENPEMEIYLISNSIHIGIVFPVKNRVIDWRESFDLSKFSTESSKMEWIEFGWGDRQFYFEMPTWDHFTLRLAFDALLLPDPAVMHVGFLDRHPTEYGSVRVVKVSYKTYEKLVASVQSWFLKKDGKPIFIPDRGYSKEDNFYEARGSYSILNTCNVWTAKVFADAGLKHPFWSPTKYGMEYLWD